MEMSIDIKGQRHKKRKSENKIKYYFYAWLRPLVIRNKKEEE